MTADPRKIGFVDLGILGLPVAGHLIQVGPGDGQRALQWGRQG